MDIAGDIPTTVKGLSKGKNGAKSKGIHGVSKGRAAEGNSKGALE